jgi:hypothetical protein
MLPLPLPDAPAAEAPAAITCFSVETACDPGILPRLIGTFAKRGLVPLHWYSRLLEPENSLSIDIQMRDLPPESAEHIAAMFRQIPGVARVLCSSGR